jgi:hypothetical protein
MRYCSVSPLVGNVELFAVAGQRRGQCVDGLADQVADIVGGLSWIVNETELGPRQRSRRSG